MLADDIGGYAAEKPDIEQRLRKRFPRHEFRARLADMGWIVTVNGPTPSAKNTTIIIGVPGYPTGEELLKHVSKEVLSEIYGSTLCART
jgi:hypothetical protein